MDDPPPSLTPADPSPHPPIVTAGVNATISSVVALIVGAFATAGLLVLAGLLSLCSLMGETCTSEEETRISLVLLAAAATFLGVPALVAALRRDARWLYAPFIELIGVGVVLIVATVS